jgi:hypothetical protein
MQAEIKVDMHGYGTMKVGAVECVVLPRYQIPIEQMPRVEQGAEDAARGL